MFNALRALNWLKPNKKLPPDNHSARVFGDNLKDNLNES